MDQVTYGTDQVDGDMQQDFLGQPSDDATSLDLRKGEAFNCYAFQT